MMRRHICLPVALLLSTFATTTVTFHLQQLPIHKLTTTTVAIKTTAKQRVRCQSSSSSLTPQQSQSRLYLTSTTSHAFLASDVDSVNTPPSLSIVLKSLDGLANGSDIRGKFVDHPRVGNFAAVAQAITASNFDNNNKAVPLTPLAAYCLGYAFAEMMKERFLNTKTNNNDEENTIRICIGTDPRSHGPRLADAFSRGCSSCSDSATTMSNNVNNNKYKIEVVYTGIATTPSMMDFCRTDLCDAAVMLTASHLPVDRNGMKFFVAGQGGFTRTDVQELISLAKEHANSLLQQSSGMIPPSSGEGGVFCAQHVDYMPLYASNLSKAIQKETSSTDKPLEGLKIVLNSGNGSGGFFHTVLQNLGADMSASIGVEHDAAFFAWCSQS
ncbi:Phosphoglucomutase/phosphomannomutase [Fragilaria crotonensis]|nr:Phosphoglucomutase/phosphomannomutase [Fragilaria crotonensis]